MSRNFTSSLVQLSSSIGVDVNVYLALDQKKVRQAQKLKTLHKYVEKYSSGWKKRLELADLLYETGQWPQAISEYKYVIQKQPQLLRARIQLGKILQLMFRQEEAIAIYETAIALAKHEATRQHLTGLIESCRNNGSSAIVAFQLATTLEPQNSTHWLALGQTQMEIEDSAAALSSFEAILSFDPDDFIGLIYSHDLLLILGNLSEAENRLSRAIDVAPEDIQTLKRIITHRCRKRWVCDMAGKQTKKLINELLTQAPDSPEAHSLLARYHILRKEAKKGLQAIKNFAEEHVKNPHAWYYYSLCLFELGKLETATTAILKAYNLSGDRCDREIYRALCQILPTIGKYEQNCCIVAEMLEKFPACWSLWANAGRVLVEHHNDYIKGCWYSLKGTQLQPQLAEAWFCHGRVLSLAGEYAAAVAALTQGWQLLPLENQNLMSVLAAIWLGENHQKLGHHQIAQNWFHRACQRARILVEFYPDQARCWFDKALEGFLNTPAD